MNLYFKEANDMKHKISPCEVPIKKKKEQWTGTSSMDGVKRLAVASSI